MPHEATGMSAYGAPYLLANDFLGRAADIVRSYTRLENRSNAPNLVTGMSTSR